MVFFFVGLIIKCLLVIFFFVDYSCKIFEDDVQCLKEMKEVVIDKSYCGYFNFKIRRSFLFNICLVYKLILVKQMFELCIYDVCLYFNDVKKRMEVVCCVVEGFEIICEVSGFDIQWRLFVFCCKILV